jgi:hypothetical protein
MCTEIFNATDSFFNQGCAMISFHSLLINVTIFVIITITEVSALSFIHPGILHTRNDIDRMKAKVNAGAQPWKSGWDRLVSNSFAQSTYKPNPQDTVCCGNVCPNGETFMPLALDCAAAYQNALRYSISGDTAYANAAIRILNAWSSTLVIINGDSNAGLRAGLYGYQLAAAAELMRGYNRWSGTDFERFKSLMRSKFYTISSDFLKRHNGTCFDHYWANWDLANMATVIATGVLCDDSAIFYEAVNYFKNGVGTGQIDRLCNNLYEGNPVLGQGQESGRDQGHATLCISLVGAFCQIAFNQGEDLFAYKNNKVLALCEYTAKYNLGYDVPWTNYTNCEKNAMTAISSSSRGTIRPCWELIYNHYSRLKKVYAPWSKMFADSIRPEGGGGNYGNNSGGFDQLGFGTLTYTLDTTITTVLQPDRNTLTQERKPFQLEKVSGHAFRYTLTNDAQVSIKLFDCRGKVHMQEGVFRKTAGVHIVDWSHSQLSPGYYCAVISVDGQVVRYPLTVIDY